MYQMSLQVYYSSYEKANSRTHLLRTPPSRDALRHSGGDSLLWTSPTVTLYLEVEESSDRRPGTLQNTSDGDDTPANTT